MLFTIFGLLTVVQRRKAEEMKSSGNETLREFESAFINIRPGGAFASCHTTDEAPRYSPVDVLAWNTQGDWE